MTALIPIVLVLGGSFGITPFQIYILVFKELSLTKVRTRPKYCCISRAFYIEVRFSNNYKSNYEVWTRDLVVRDLHFNAQHHVYIIYIYIQLNVILVFVGGHIN